MTDLKFRKKFLKSVSLSFTFFNIIFDRFRDEEEKENKKNEEYEKKDDKSEEELSPKFLDIYSSIYAMRQELDLMRKPTGTRDNPVRTCKDLFYGYPHFKDGKTISYLLFFFFQSYNKPK